MKDLPLLYLSQCGVQVVVDLPRQTLWCRPLVQMRRLLRGRVTCGGRGSAERGGRLKEVIGRERGREGGDVCVGWAGEVGVILQQGNRPHTSFAEPVAAPIAARQLHAHRFYLKEEATAQRRVNSRRFGRCGTL